jgi:hypothetical protein
MYLRCSALIQKQVSENILFFAVAITFTVQLFQIFTHILLSKIKKLELSYLYERLSYISTSNNKTYLFCSALQYI